MDHEPSPTDAPGPSATEDSDVHRDSSGATRAVSNAECRAKESKRQSKRLLLNAGKRGQRAAQNKAAHSSGAPLGCTEQALTRVEFTPHDRPFAMWLRFGKPKITLVPAPGHPAECYAPGQVFGLARSVSHHDGDAQSTFDVLEAGQPEDDVTAQPCVRPGAHILLSAKGWRTVSRVFSLIDAIEALGIDPCCLAPAFWTEIQSHLPHHRTHVPDAGKHAQPSAQDARRRS
ncbi:DUF2840 domain-containing protein [Blastomonas sp.]|uniref:DUF2840 domain-containing protein n=1 Tax=Blastomonas sp. TaxID=1909299 RepID=UPI00406AAB80